MSEFKIPEVASLGRVLSKEELKAIIGGGDGKVTCTCTLKFKVNVNGYDYYRTEQADPSGVFGSKDECEFACNAKCKETPDCNSAD